MNIINTVSNITDPSLPLRIRASRADLIRGEGKVECQITLPSHYGGNTRRESTLGEICVQRSTQPLTQQYQVLRGEKQPTLQKQTIVNAILYADEGIFTRGRHIGLFTTPMYEFYVANHNLTINI